EVARAAEIRDGRAQLQAHDARAAAMLGALWRGADTDWARVRDLLDWAGRLHRVVLRLSDAPGSAPAARRIVDLATDHADLLREGKTGDALRAFADASARWQAA